MITFKKKSPVILYLHGYKSFPGDSIEQTIRKGCPEFDIKSIQLDHMNPEKTYHDVIEASRGVDIVIGFSMGGFWASLIPKKVKKIYINPAFLFPYIVLYKTGSRKLFKEYLGIASNQFNDRDSDSTLIYYKKDKTEPLGLFNVFYGGKVIDKLSGHVPNESELKKYIIPECY